MPSLPFPPRRRAALLLAGLLLCGVMGLWGQDVTPSPSASPEAVTASPTPAPTATVTPVPTTAQVLYPSKGVPNLAANPQGGTGGTANLATTFLVLLGLCGGGYYLMRKQPHLVAGFKGGPRKLNVSESRTLGNRQFLVVVEYENERMLLGVTPGRIDYLCPLRVPGGADATVFPEPGGAKS